jgi:hypothetical protein
MFSNPDLPARPALELMHNALLATLAVTLLLAGCAGPAGTLAAAATGASVMPPVAAAPAANPPLTPPPRTATPSTTDAVTRVLAYAQRVRMMPAAALNQEVTRLGTPASPTEQVQLSLALSQLLQLPDLIRAQELLARVLANPDAEAQALHPLAGLLASRYGDLRRLEDQMEKQTQQTRDVQRRLDQTTERLEALKAIERSLTSRPPAPSSSAPTNRASNAPSQ